MTTEWADRLSDKFDWTDKEPNQKTVIALVA